MFYHAILLLTYLCLRTSFGTELKTEYYVDPVSADSVTVVHHHHHHQNHQMQTDSSVKDHHDHHQMQTDSSVKDHHDHHQMTDKPVSHQTSMSEKSVLDSHPMTHKSVSDSHEVTEKSVLASHQMTHKSISDSHEVTDKSASDNHQMQMDRQSVVHSQHQLQMDRSMVAANKVMNHDMHKDHEDMDMDDHKIDMDHHNMSDMGMMMMYFHFGVKETVLFKDWKITTDWGMIASMVGIFILGMLYEGLKYLREFLFKKYVSSIQFSTVAITGEAGRVTQVHKVEKHRMLSLAHALQTALHILQIILSYFLMLIFMTYNVWLCISVVLGAGVGYFIFGWKKATVVDITEHCH